MSRRHPKLPLGLRIVAGGCIAVWLTAVSACSLEALFCCNKHERDHPAVAHSEHMDALVETHHVDEGEGHHSHDAEGRSHKQDGKGNSCCTTLKANVQTLKPFVFNKPAFQPIPFLCVLLETRATVLALSDKPPLRQAKSREWVFTPEVCTGPANRSHAPPAPV
jgi:hypothetical protein